MEKIKFENTIIGIILVLYLGVGGIEDGDMIRGCQSQLSSVFLYSLEST